PEREVVAGSNDGEGVRGGQPQLRVEVPTVRLADERRPDADTSRSVLLLPESHLCPRADHRAGELDCRVLKLDLNAAVIGHEAPRREGDLARLVVDDVVV